ncbi:MAG: transcription antiterminator [Erysipelotrichaceae bacterium]|nr:transcription antiterminator [Erysipelotrichaceae bacterium]
MKNKIYADIIRYLVENKNSSYISSEQIAYSLNISKRTVLSYMKKIKQDAPSFGFEIVTKQGYGCRLEVREEHVFSAWYSEFFNNEIISDVERRRKIIFTNLILSGDYVNVYDLADELYISASLVRKDIKNLRPLIERYNLKLMHSHSHGYLIYGEEKDIRKAIAKECSEYLENYSGEEHSEYRTEVLEKLSVSINKHLTSANISISTQSIHSLAIHILIAINRMETNNTIPIGNVHESVKDSVEYITAESINEDIYEIFGVSLSNDELYYFSQHIKGNNSNALEKNLVADLEDSEVIEFYNLFLRGIYKQSNVDFFNDTNLRLNLLNHISLFISRLKENTQIVRSNLSGIKDEFPYANELAILGLRGIEQKYKKAISEQERLYFAIHLALSLETNKSHKKYNFAVILDDSVTVFQLISHKLNQIFKDRINIIQLIMPEHLNKTMMGDFDIILDTTDSKNGDYFITVEKFLNERDVASIKMAIDKLDQKNDLNQFMSEDLYFVMDCSNKEELLKKMIHQVSQKMNFNEDEFFSSVIEREKCSSTAYSKRIATPHPLESTKFPEFISVCRLNKPVLWDERYVQLIFLFSLNSSQKVVQEFFDKLSKLIMSHDKIFLLQKTDNYFDFVEEFYK